MTAPRFPDWPARLQALITERLHMPFTWGRQDCCLFVCDAVLALTGHDPAAGLRGYKTERGAARVLKQHGGVHQLAQTRLGVAIPLSLAQVGDVGLVQQGGRDSLALWAGAAWLAPGPQGLVSLPFTAAVAAWRGA